MSFGLGHVLALSLHTGVGLNLSDSQLVTSETDAETRRAAQPTQRLRISRPAHEEILLFESEGGDTVTVPWRSPSAAFGLLVFCASPKVPQTDAEFVEVTPAGLRSRCGHLVRGQRATVRCMLWAPASLGWFCVTFTLVSGWKRKPTSTATIPSTAAPTKETTSACRFSDALALWRFQHLIVHCCASRVGSLTESLTALMNPGFDGPRPPIPRSCQCDLRTFQ